MPLIPVDFIESEAAVQTAVVVVGKRRKKSIFERKTLSVRPEKSEKAKPFTSSMEGPTFFDEDGDCACLEL